MAQIPSIPGINFDWCPIRVHAFTADGSGKLLTPGTPATYTEHTPSGLDDS
jgi:hypothetical protein